MRDKAQRALELAPGLSLKADQTLFTEYADELRQRADELERQAAAQSPNRPAEPGRDATSDEPNPKRGRGGSNDPDPQA